MQIWLISIDCSSLLCDKALDAICILLNSVSIFQHHRPGDMYRSLEASNMLICQNISFHPPNPWRNSTLPFILGSISISFTRCPGMALRAEGQIFVSRGFCHGARFAKALQLPTSQPFMSVMIQDAALSCSRSHSGSVWGYR